MTAATALARDERNVARREAYDQRMAYLATPRGVASRTRARAKADKAHAERLDRYAHGLRGGTAHHHIPGGRIRRAAKAGQRARRALRAALHPADPRPARVRDGRRQPDLPARPRAAAT